MPLPSQYMCWYCYHPEIHNRAGDPAQSYPIPIHTCGHVWSNIHLRLDFFRSRSWIQISDWIFSDPDHNALCDDLSLCLRHPHLPLLPQTLHHHPPPRKERQVITMVNHRKLTMNTVGSFYIYLDLIYMIIYGTHTGSWQWTQWKFLYSFKFDLYDNIWNAHRKLTMNTVKRPTVLAAAMPLMAATTVDATLCKGIGEL